MEWIDNHFKIIQAVISIVFLIIVWALAVTFVKKKEHSATNSQHSDAHSKLAGRVSEIELTYSTQDQHVLLASRVGTLENKVDELPNKETIHRVESEVKQLKGQLGGIEQLQRHMSNQLDMLVENELRGSNK